MTESERRKYVIITPVKDEASYIQETLASVTTQTVLPHRWVIVDDGSSDETPTIVRQYCERYPWMTMLSLKTLSGRYPGSPVISAFQHGADVLQNEDYDYIVKLDADLRLPPDYFQNVFDKFALDERLGIASGVYLEKAADSWSVVRMPAYHAAGASKVIRRKCFRDIGGFLASLGWDTLDEIKAQAKGWTTAHFDDIHFYHLKKEGTGIGRLRTSVLHGRIFYLTGGSPLFFLIKALKRTVVGAPPLLGGILMAWGYCKAALSREERLVTGEEAALYNRLLAERLVSKAKAILS